METKPTCFVAMGFGEKTDLATGRKLNLDSTYNNVIKPAVEAEGYDCKRADEINYSGMIDIPMYDWLFRADLVVVDLSTSNLNATFELGVRYALKPRSTVILAEKQFVSPFDVNHIKIHKYEHLGPDIGYGETMKMQKKIRELLRTLQTTDRPDSPIYTLMHQLRPPFEVIPEGGTSPSDAAKAIPPEESYGVQLSDALADVQAGKFQSAKVKLQAIFAAQSTPRTRIVQNLALVTYKAGEKALKAGASEDVAEVAYQQAIDLLQEHLDPDHTTDPETLGLWSAVHKRRADLQKRTAEQRRSDLDAAIYCSERGFLIRQDYYNGINLAYLLDLRASLSSDSDQVADQVLADRVRKRVVGFARNRLAEIDDAIAKGGVEKDIVLTDEAFWVHASLAEALIALRDPDGGKAWKEAKSRARHPWMLETSSGQVKRIVKIRKLDFDPDVG